MPCHYELIPYDNVAIRFLSFMYVCHAQVYHAQGIYRFTQLKNDIVLTLLVKHARR